MFLKSGSLNLKGMLDTWSLLGVVCGFGAGSKGPLLLMIGGWGWGCWAEATVTAAAGGCCWSEWPQSLDVATVGLWLLGSPLVLTTATGSLVSLTLSIELSSSVPWNKRHETFHWFVSLISLLQCDYHFRLISVLLMKPWKKPVSILFWASSDGKIH